MEGLAALIDVREATKDDPTAWAAMRASLWPDADVDELKAEAIAHFESPTMLERVFICDDADGAPIGMLELSLRSHADGCTSSPVPYVEGWYVAADRRGIGVGRALMWTAEEWSRANGYREIASDCLLTNYASASAHHALGFEEVDRNITFRKAL